MTPLQDAAEWLNAALNRLSSATRLPFSVGAAAAITLLVVVLSAAMVFMPVTRIYALQLMYLPILFTAGAWGALPASAVGLLAAVDAMIHPLPAIDATWFLQLSLYMSTALVGARLFRSLRPQIGASQIFDTLSRPTLIGRERVLESLSRTVEVRDHHTQGHCQRVAKNAQVVGQALGLQAEELDILYWAAILHDIGKIAIPEYILLKNGRLTEEEFAEIRRHPAYGADLLASVSLTFRPIADVVRAHHERWDGMGYPLGYSGREIPRLARIIAVVDVFEALTSERPYRSPMPVAQALSYVIGGAGTQFDPEIVPVFRRLVEAGVIDCGVATGRPVTGRQSTSSDGAIQLTA